MTADVSLDRWIANLRARKANLTEPRHRAMVDVFIEHIEAERACDVERFLAHQVEHPVYRRFGAVEWHLPPDVKQWYSVMESGGEFPEYEMEMERFFVGDDGIATDGVLKMRSTGRKLVAHNMTLPADGAEDDTYIVTRRFAMFIPFVEDTYRDPPTITRVENP
jgi:hypothetical protein